MDNLKQLQHTMQEDLPRIADALYQEHPNAWEVIRQYMEQMVRFTQLLEENRDSLASFDENYPIWGNAMGLLLDAFEQNDRVLVADVITFEILPVLSKW